MSRLLYKPGDTVIVRSDLVGEKEYPVWYGPDAGRELWCNRDMTEFRGKTLKIKGYIFDENFYTVEENQWDWTESMFENQKECFCESLL